MTVVWTCLNSRMHGCPPQIGLGPDLVRHGQDFWGCHLVYQGTGGRSFKSCRLWGAASLDWTCFSISYRYSLGHLHTLSLYVKLIIECHYICMIIRTQDFPAEHCIVTRCSMVLTYNHWSFSCIVHFTCLTKITEKATRNWSVITFVIHPSTDYFCWLIFAR